jgi:thiol-disulfide isomerase/thioredoxin
VKRRALWRGFALLLAATFARPVGAEDSKASFVWLDAPRALPEIRFETGGGEARTLADFRGKVVLLNVWATWCGPCRKEMPTLDRLQARLGGPDFTVVPLSIDRQGVPAVNRFYEEIGIAHLGLYVDSSNRAGAALGLTGLPTTVLIDREGNEVARLVGPAEWDGPDMIALIEQYLKTGVEKTNAVTHGKCPCPMAKH